MALWKWLYSKLLYRRLLAVYQVEFLQVEYSPLTKRFNVSLTRPNPIIVQGRSRLQYVITPLRDIRVWLRETISSPPFPNPLSTNEGQLPRTIVSLLSSETNHTTEILNSEAHVQCWYRLRYSPLPTAKLS